MLSILIPTYSYNVYPLVVAIQKQCTESNITFEVIVFDDGSGSSLNSENEKINSLQNCLFKAHTENRGRSAIRNLLAKTAKYDWLLFLDADTIPASDNLIANYIPYINNDEKVVYGGIKYQDIKPDKNQLLRWVYGNKREALPVKERAKSPHLRLLTLNFLIKKTVFDNVCFNEDIPNLRHEDTLFSYELMVNKIPVMHIANEVYHLGLDTSEVFIKKSEESVTGLQYLLKNNYLPADYLQIAKTKKRLNRYGVSFFAILAFRLLKKPFQNNLKSNTPSLFIFDIYRLGYFCTLK